MGQGRRGGEYWAQAERGGILSSGPTVPSMARAISAQGMS